MPLSLFSQKITLTYNGADRYRTRPGAAVTILLVVCCLAFSLFRLNVMINRGSPTISKSSFMKDLGLSGPFYPFEYGFDISFGLGQPLDPNIGYYVANQIYFYYPADGGPRNKTRIPLDFTACGQDLFNSNNFTTTLQYGINNYMCF